MKKLHEKLSQRSKAYSSWHNVPHHKPTHWFVFLTVVVLVSVFLINSISNAYPTYAAKAYETNTSITLKNKVKSLNTQFRETREKLDRGTPGSEKNLVQLAKNRKESLLELIQKDSKLAGDVLFSQDELDDLPAEVSKYMEEHVSLDGIYRAEHGEPKNLADKPIESYTLETTDGAYYLHQATDEKLPIEHGIKARVKGVKIDKNVLITDEVGGGIQKTGDAIVVDAAALANHKVAVAIINSSAGVDQVRQALLQTNGLISEQSYGKTTVSGDVFEVNITASCVDYYLVATQADDALRAQGINLGAYTNTMYFVPGCSFSGLGQVIGTKTWINSAYVNAGVMTHELGHNQGAKHASTPGSEYGEQNDNMGNAWAMRGQNAPHRYQLGWLPTSNIQSVTTPGIYTIATTETLGSQKQILKIPKNSTQSYYVSLRNSYGIFDAGIATGVAIHEWVTTPSLIQTMNLAILGIGQLFEDPLIGLKITPLSMDASTATVEVSFGCNRNNPTLQIYNDTTVSAGAIVPYSFEVKNNDSVTCPTSSTYSLSSTLPAGWTQSTVADFTLAPGAVKNPQPSITIPASTPTGRYTITETVRDISNPNITASANGTIIVSLPDSTGPTFDLYPADGTLLTGSKLRISVYAQDSGSGVKSTSITLDGVVKKTCLTTSCIYSTNMSKLPKGPHTITGTATDKAGNTSTKTNNVTR